MQPTWESFSLQHKVKPANFVARPEEVSIELSALPSDDSFLHTAARVNIPLTFAFLSVGSSNGMELGIEENVLVSCDYSGRMPLCRSGYVTFRLFLDNGIGAVSVHLRPS